MPRLESEPTGRRDTDVIEITPAMVEAGVDAFYLHWDDDGFSDPDADGVIRKVILAALEAAQKS